MRILTLKEPFATLICNKVKTIETRSWRTNYRGEINIAIDRDMFYVSVI